MTGRHEEPNDIDDLASDHADDRQQPAGRDLPPVHLVKSTPAPGGHGIGADEVLEGELVNGPRTVVRTVVNVATHPRSRAMARQLVYVVEGAAIVAKWIWDSRTVARYQRMMRAAEAHGDNQMMLEWEVREAAFRQARHQRRMDLLALPARVLAALPQVILGAVALLVGIGTLLAIAANDVSQLAVPILVVANVVAVLALVISVVWGPLLLAVPWVVIVWLWSVGRRGTGPLTWLATAADADVDLTIDENTIGKALEALRIPQITAYMRDGLPLQYITPARRDGRGTHAVLRLPAGVTAERIARRRADLATGLYRLAKEVWPTTGSEEGILDLWVADKGALAEGAGPYPLLTEGFVDVFRGVPFGRTLRGDPITAPVAGRNTIVGGMPDQGKSSAARVIMAGYALDPTAELCIWVPDNNFDFEAFAPRCSRYVMGADDEAIEQIRDDLLELKAELQTRGELLIEHEEPEVSRELADKSVGLHPKVCLLEEAHVAINHRIYGDEIAGLLIDIVKLDRKRLIHFILSTQAPTSASMPRDVTRNCSNGIAFAVSDTVANDALLGQGAYRGGHRATELIPGVDKGTAVVKGFTGERSALVQAYFLSVKRGNDQVTPIIERAMSEIARRGGAIPGQDKPRPTSTPRDLLADLDEVLGTERVKLADAAVLLRKLAPDWPAYKTLTGARLGRLLADYDIRITNTANVKRLDPADIRRIRARQRPNDDLVHE